MNRGWKIVTNGKTYRLMDSLGNFATVIVSCFIAAAEVPLDFNTLEQAQIELARLEQKDKDNTWVPV